jgi:hypothetical protein
MKKLIKHITLLGLLMLVVSTRIIAQDGTITDYVVLVDGDTLYGKIQIRNPDKAYSICIFNESNTSENIEYLPKDLKAYRAVSMLYETVEYNEEVANKVTFMEVLANGKATLYRYYERYFIKKDSNLVELTNEEFEQLNDEGILTKRESKKYIGVLKYLLSDCDEVTGQIGQVELGERSLVTLIEKYNECMGSSAVDTYKDNLKWVAVRKSLVVKVSVGKFVLNGSDPVVQYIVGTYQPSTAFEVGGNLEFYSQRKNEKLSFTLGLNYANQTWTSANQNIQRTGTEVFVTTTSESTLELNQLKIPLGVRRWFNRNNWAPYINLGIQPMFNLRSETSTTITTEYFSSIQSSLNRQTVENQNMNPFSTMAFGFYGGTGLSKSLIPNELFLDIELRYEYSTVFPEIEYRKYNLYNSLQLLSFQLGLTF